MKLIELASENRGTQLPLRGADLTALLLTGDKLNQ